MKKRVEKVKLVCVDCSKEYEKYPSELKANPSNYCSKKCMDNNRKHGTNLKCEFCDKEFYRRFGDQRKQVTKFCSNECYFNSRVLNAKKTTYLKNGATHIHILVAEKTLNRKLKKGEVVHHIDENKHNNLIENLAILPSQAFHAKVHFGKVDFDEYKLINLI